MITVDKIYQSISENIAENCPDSWNKAVIEAQVFEGAVKLKGGYYIGDTYTSFKFRKFDRRIINDFEELHAITHNDSSGKWNRALFSLQADGNFSIDFNWDQDLADEIEPLKK